MKFGAFRFFCIATVLGSLTVLAAKVQASLPAPAADKPKVMVQELKISDDTRRLLVPATVEASVSSQVFADTEGLVTKIKKPLGSRVKAGEVVLLIENKDPAFTYAKVPVRSPVSGVISQMNPALMTRVNRNDRLFLVTDPSSLKLSAEIPGGDLALVQPGAKGMFKQSLESKEGPAIRVVGVTPFVDPRTGTASAELEFVAVKGKKIELPAIGSVGHAFFEISRGKVLLIPESALGYQEGKPMVKLLGADGLVKRKTIELGEQKESQLVVKSGLAEGEKLIVRSSRSVREGEAVEVESDSQKN